MSPLGKFGLLLLPIGLAVGWGRVYLGAHFPLDILGGAALGVFSAFIVRSVPWRRALWTMIECVYLRVLGLVF